MKPRIEVALEPKSYEIEFLNQQILNFNRNRVGEGDYRYLATFLRSAGDQIGGGVVGATYWQWLYIDVLWIHESFRGSGYGDALLATIEQEAMKRGCQYAYLDTFSFQAPEFHQKRGYVIFGELPNFPEGHRRFFLKKELEKTL